MYTVIREYALVREIAYKENLLDDKFFLTVIGNEENVHLMLDWDTVKLTNISQEFFCSSIFIILITLNKCYFIMCCFANQEMAFI